ncbi:transcription repressor OFP13-like [Typha angustifolia]|uniref:transcription repressor OFP13-like n=1 Tax=Typha angustifolia TaxID=59011 RepID=UPI003C2F91D7
MAKKSKKRQSDTSQSKPKTSPPHWLFSDCDHLKTLSFDRYVGAGDDVTCGRGPTYWYGPTELSPRLTEPPRGSISATDRFFVSPAETSSLVEEARRSSAASSSSTFADNTGHHVTGACGGVAVVEYSTDPRGDFKASMAEMLVARDVERGESLDWEFMEELLLCYLEINERSVHKYILSAFADLLTFLYPSPAPSLMREIK